MTRTLAVLLLLACLATGPPVYTRVAVRDLAGREEKWGEGARLLVSGTWRPDGPFERLVRGVLEEESHRIRVLGSAFDWMPPAGRNVDFWGVLRRETSRWYLEFHNGRLRGDPSRKPRPTPPLQPDQQVELVARLRQSGHVPFVRWVAETEDRVVIELINEPAASIPSGTIARVRIEIRSAGPLGVRGQLLSADPVPGALPPAPGG